jgi:hypothetical protein
MERMSVETRATPSQPNLGLEVYRAGINTVATFYGSFADAYAQMGTEWLDFINRRIHVDLSLPTRLANCTAPQQYMDEWRAFMKTAADDYRDEIARLMEMNTTVSREAVTALRSGSNSKHSSTWPGL